MLVPMNHFASSPLHVACRCDAWCRLSEGDAPVFGQALQPLRTQHPGLRVHWIDIADEIEMLGDLNVETFLIIVVADDRQIRLTGPLTPQPETLRRGLRAALAEPHARSSPPREVQPFSRRLRAAHG